MSYVAYGNSTKNSLTRCGYAGRELDADTGLMYYRARWYDPQLGRFIREDPIGFAGCDVNFFGYVRNNPLRFTDPAGLSRCNPYLGALLGGLGGAVVGGVTGAGLGAAIGGIGGAIVGLAAGPPGSVIVGGGGTAAGAAIGLYFGTAIGAGVGIGIGYDYCSADDTPTCENSPKAVPMPLPVPDSVPLIPPVPPMEFGKRNKWTCVARCNVENYGNVPGAPTRVETTGLGPTESLACQNAISNAQTLSPLGTYTRHCGCIRCWRN